MQLTRDLFAIAKFLYLLRIFSGCTGATMFFEGHDGDTPRHAPVRSGAGAEMVRKLNERERSGKKYGGAHMLWNRRMFLRASAMLKHVIDII